LFRAQEGLEKWFSFLNIRDNAHDKTWFYLCFMKNEKMQRLFIGSLRGLNKQNN